MAKEEQKEGEVADGKSGSKKMIIIIVGVLVLLIAVGAGLFFTGFFDDKAATDNNDPTKEQSDEAAKGDESESEAAPIYMALTPGFMVNFPSGGIKIMKISISVMARDEKVIDAIKLHDPVIRNNVLLLLSAEDPEVLKTADGKAKLQLAILEAINKILKERKVASTAESVFFTDMVMQ